MFAWLFRRRRKPQPVVPAADPADELKQKLAESRVAEPEPEQAPEPESKARPLEERRRAIHDRAQAAIDQMRGETEAE